MCWDVTYYLTDDVDFKDVKNGVNVSHVVDVIDVKGAQS